MENFDAELKTYYLKIKDQIKKEHVEYVDKHPEIRDVLNDFVSSLLLEKPDDVYKYAQDYFTFFNSEKEILKLQPLVIVGPNGAGKKAVQQYLINTFSDMFQTVVQVTSRPQKENELNGKHYHFISRLDFLDEITEGQFVESCELNGDYYGTLKSSLSDIIASGKIAILILDLERALKVSHYYPQSSYLLVNTDSTDELLKRQNQNFSKDATEDFVKKSNDLISQAKESGIFHEIINKDIKETHKQVNQFLKNKYPSVKFEK